MTIDVPVAQRIAIDFEQRPARKWLCRLSYFAVASGGLALEAAGIFLGGTAAETIAPSLMSADDFSALVLTYVVVAVLINSIQLLVPKGRFVGRWTVWLALILGLTANRIRYRNDLEAVAACLFVAGLCTILTQLAQKWLRDNILNQIPWRPTIVAFLGNSESAAATLDQLRKDGGQTSRVIGFFDDRLGRPGPLSGILPCLGRIDDLVSYIHDAELSEVYMALPWSAGPRISQLLEQLRFLPLTVRLVPDHVPPALPGRGGGQLHGVVMPTLMLPPFSAAAAVMKRGIDICLSTLLLVPLLPLFLVVAICLRIESPGPVFFRQVRSGQFGRPFRIFKFRSLRVDQADIAAETLVVAGDRRVTRVGQVMRKYSIDELPQVFNVLLGEMSLVGPRPHAPRAKADGRIYAEVIPEYMLRYRVKPGMTGWAQVNGWRGNTDTEEQLRKRVEFDFDYIKAWSAWQDLRIMFRTIPAMLLPPAQNV